MKRWKFISQMPVISSVVLLSTCVTENGKTSQISFSGDIGRYNDAILRSPDVFPQADYILLESTYGSTLYAEAAPSDDLLIKYIHDTCKVKKGKLIIPAFSVGRTQELLYALNRAELDGNSLKWTSL